VGTFNVLSSEVNVCMVCDLQTGITIAMLCTKPFLLHSLIRFKIVKAATILRRKRGEGGL